VEALHKAVDEQYGLLSQYHRGRLELTPTEFDDVRRAALILTGMTKAPAITSRFKQVFKIMKKSTISLNAFRI
jgi:hypothetical protein